MEGNQCLMSQASEDQGIDDEQVNLTPAKARSDRPRTTNGKAFEANGMLEMDVKEQQKSVKRTVRNASMMNDEVENDQQLEAGQQSTISLEEGEKRTAQKASITDGETFEENDALEKDEEQNTASTSQNSPAMPPVTSGQYGSHSFISGHSVAVSGSTMVANNTFNIKIYRIRSSRRVRRR